jgi:hypothetical protein
MTSAAVTSPALLLDRPLSSPARWSVGVVGAALCAFAVALVATSTQRDPVDRAVVEALVVGVPLAVGLWATRSPTDVRFGALLIGAGGIWSLTALGYTSDSLAYSIGRTAGWLIFPVLMYLMLAFPDGRLTGSDRRLYGALALLVAMLFVGSVLFIETYPPTPPGRAAKRTARRTRSSCSTPSPRSSRASCSRCASCSPFWCWPGSRTRWRGAGGWPRRRGGG